MTALDHPLRPYFEALDSGNTAGIPAMFTPDATYVRPSAPSPDSPQLGGLEVVQGRTAIKEYFDRRGVLALRHFITSSATNGRHCFVDGVVTVPDVPGVTDMAFMCHAIFNDDGLISFYAGFVEVVAPEVAALFTKNSSPN